MQREPLRKILNLITFAFFLISTSYCEQVEIINQEKASIDTTLEENEKLPGENQVRAKKPWTFLVYVAANNNLHTFALQNIRQMAQVGSNENINIVVQFDGIGERAIKRYLIEGGQTKLLNTFKPEIETMSGTPQSLYQFIKWGSQAFPSTYIAIDLWNHGSGIKDPSIWGKFLMNHRDELYFLNTETGFLELNRHISLDDEIQLEEELHFNTRSSWPHLIAQLIKKRGIAFNDKDEVYIDNQQLKAVLDNVCRYVLLGKKIDIVFMDACHMGMVEVASKLQPYTHYMVASPEVEPGTGYDYNRLLLPFKAGTLAPREFAIHGVAAYEAQYKGSYADYTQSAVDLAAFKAIEPIFARLAKTLYEALNIKDSKIIFDTLKTVRFSSKYSTEFYDPDYIDAGSFFINTMLKFRELLTNNSQLTQEQRLIAENIASECESGWRTLKASILAETHGRSLMTSNGLGLFFPKGNIHGSYLKTTFDKATGWSMFLTKFISKLKYGRKYNN